MWINVNRLLQCARVVALAGVLAICPTLLAQEEAGQVLPADSAPPVAIAETLPSAPPPEPAEKAPAGRIRIRAQRQIFSPGHGLYQFSGEVSVTRSDMELRAAEMVYDANAELMTAKGEVTLTPGDGQTYRGQALEYRPVTGAWQFREWSAALPPSAFGPPVVAPVFTKGESIAGGAGNGLAMAHTHLTTCDFDAPHYEIVARTVDIFPGDKLIARDIDVYIAGKRIVRLPWLFFFLRRDRPAVMPEFGNNEIEGYFVRTPFQYVLGSNQLGTFRLDLTEKRGVGLGVNHFYALGSGGGEAFAYTNPASGDYALRLRHDQQLLPTLALDTSFDRKRQSLLSGTPVKTSNTMVRLRNTTEHTSTLAQYTQNNTDGTFNLRSTSLSLRQNINTGDNKFSYNGEYRSTGYGAAPDNQELWNRLHYTRRLNFGDLNVRMDHYTDMDENPGGFSFNRLERLPEVMLQVDQTRLGWKVPGRLQVGWGSYRERAGNDPLGRFLLDWQTTPRLSLTKNTALQFNAGLRQTIYGDEEVSAQYHYRFDVSALTKVGNATNTLSYGRLYGDGFSPLFMDAVYPRHAVTNSLRYDTPSVRLSLTAGRDLQWNRWHDLALTAEERVGEHLRLRQQVSFDPNASRWRDLTNQLDWQQDPRLALSLYARYNLDQQQLRSATAQLRWDVTPQWQLRWRGNYDGRQFLWNEWLIVRDLHCWEAALRFDPTRGTFGLTFRPTALESTLIPEIGIGLNNRWTLGTGVAF